jgi:hypothetical protein
MQVFNDALHSHMTYTECIAALCSAEEFAAIKVRDEELSELSKVRRACCRVAIPATADDGSAKANVLLQAHISGMRVQSFTLSSDMMCVRGRGTHAVALALSRLRWEYYRARSTSVPLLLADRTTIHRPAQYPTAVHFIAFSTFPAHQQCQIPTLHTFGVVSIWWWWWWWWWWSGARVRVCARVCACVFVCLC